MPAAEGIKWEAQGGIEDMGNDARVKGCAKDSGGTFRVLYIFAGRKRQSGLVPSLRKMARGLRNHKVKISAVEVDILQGRSHNLLIP